MNIDHVHISNASTLQQCVTRISYSPVSIICYRLDACIFELSGYLPPDIRNLQDLASRRPGECAI